MESPVSRVIYDQLDAKLEKCSELIYFVNFKVTLPCVAILNFVKSFYSYFTTDVGNDAFQLPAHAWFPFDWKNPCGYLIAFSLEFAGTYYVLCFCSCFMIFFVGISFILISMVEGIKKDLLPLQIYHGKPKNEVFKRTMLEFMDLYCNSREIAHNFVGIQECIILVFFMWSFTTICVILLSIQMELEHVGMTFALINLLVMMLQSFALVFIFCEFGSRISGQFYELSDVIYQSNWYLHSADVQNLLPTILIAAQDPFVVRGFGNISCTRETFIKVVKSGYSCFTVLRRFR